MAKHLSDKRLRQLAFLPYTLERVVDLILTDSEYGLHHPESISERDELSKSVPVLRDALERIRQERKAIVKSGRAYVSLQRDYKELFQRPLVKRKTGYALILLVYMCQQLLEEGGDLSDNILDAVNMITPIAEKGSNAKMIDGMAHSAERMAPKMIKELRRRDYLLIENMRVAV
ncbi:hypothetical protein [uncultured Kiloniella sp.]|uniref:hypothetical protein n=1 Tax=uncultured Kiloniella sp. TaxID=1133091 RepID=UPI002604E297|nr:hypothetical protein [uncultured Kiloniella sp.]